MMNNKHFSYKGYTGSIEFSTEDMCLFGRVQMINDLVMYDGQTLDELKLAFESAVEEYLEMCELEGKDPNKPVSGTFNVRIPEAMHRQCITEANLQGVSLNSFIGQCVQFFFNNRQKMYS